MTKTVTSPLPGIFYRTSGADQPPFKSEGDKVAVGDTVGLIEVMKTYTPIIAEEAGTVVRFLVESEEDVAPGQPLLELE